MSRYFSIHILYCAVFVGFTAIIVTEVLSRIPILEPVSDSIFDWDFTDIAYKDVNKDSVIIDDRIVLVNISDPENMNRQDIGHLLQKIDKEDPKVIGLLVFFSDLNDQEQDSVLSTAISDVDNLVMVVAYHDSLQYSHPKFSTNIGQGLSNLMPGNQGTMRKIISNKINQTDTLRSFASEVASYYDLNSSRDFNNRNLEWEWINYSGSLNSYQSIDYFERDFRIVKDKIVLIGYLGESIESGSQIWNNVDSKYYTPLKTTWFNKQLPDMFGLVLHANAVKMVLDQTYISSSGLLDDLISIFLILLSVLIMYAIMIKLPKRYSLISRVTSLGLIALMITIAIYSFKLVSLKIELSFVVLFLVFLPDSLEFYNIYFHPIYTSISKNIQRFLKYSILLIISAPYLLSLIFGYQEVFKRGRIEFFVGLAILWLFLYSLLVTIHWIRRRKNFPH